MSGEGTSPTRGLTRQLADRAQVVGHAAHSGDAGIEPATHLRPRGLGVGRRGEMDMGVDQAGQDIEARDVDQLCGLGQGIAVRLDGCDPLAAGDDGQAGPRRRASRPVEQDGAAIGEDLRLGGRGRRLGRGAVPGEKGIMGVGRGGGQSGRQGRQGGAGQPVSEGRHVCVSPNIAIRFGAGMDGEQAGRR